MSQPNLTTGLLAAAGILVIWSGFIVFSRAGLVSGMTPYDVAGLRFLTAGLLTLPFVWAWWPRHLSWRALAALAIAGPGAIYSLMMFAGLANASAAYGGVFANGALPVFTMLIALVVHGTRPKPQQIGGAILIICGGVMVAWRGISAGGPDLVVGIALFLASSAMIAIYIFALNHWRITPRQALAVVNVPNPAIFVPVWLLFLPSTLSEVPMVEVIAQAAFQGLGPGFLAVIVFALMAFHLGATPAAAVSASVPATAALLAVPVLGEVPTILEWAGIGTVSLGLWWVVRAR